MNALPPARTLQSIAHLPLWIVWRSELRNGKKTKIPYNPEGGMAKADDPGTWGIRHRAEIAIPRIVNGTGGGLGLEFAEIGGGLHLGGIDLDTCRDPATGAIEPWAQEVIARFGSYAEVSPSRTGVKMFFAYRTEDRGQMREAMGSQYGKLWQRGGTEHPPAIELHIGNRYFAVTGKRLADAPETIETIAVETLLWLVREAGPAFKGKLEQSFRTLAESCARGEGIIDRLNRAATSSRVLRTVLGKMDRYGSRSEAAMALGSAVKAAGWSRDDMSVVLHHHPATAEWAAEKGEAAGQRELDRIWNRAAGPGDDAPEWREPDLSLIQQEATAAPAIPENVLPAFWAKWTADAAEGASAPQAFVAAALLSAAGIAIGNARWANPWHDWKEPPAVNCALIGRPSSGKSPALDQLTGLLTSLEAEANDDLKERRREAQRDTMETAEKMKTYEKEVKTAVSQGNRAPLPPADCQPVKMPQRRRIYSTDPTIEKAGRLGEANPRGLLLLRDELAGWLAGMDRYSGASGGDRAFWLQAYGGRAWTPDRVKDEDEPVNVPHLLWSILGTIQPDRVASLMMGGDDDGLTARFLYCWPDSLPPRRPRSTADTQGALAAFRRLRSLSWMENPEPKVLPFTAEAAGALQEWREQIAAMETDAAGLMLSWLGKLPGLAVRIGLILELLDWSTRPSAAEPEAIGERAVTAAITFLHDFAIPMGRRTFGAAALPQAERDARRLARWLIRQSPIPETVNARKLRHRGDGPGIPDAERMERALAELSAAEWTRQAFAREGGPGRFRKDWAINPRLAEVRQ